MTPVIVVPCRDRGQKRLLRHSWEEVPGVHSTPEHPYTERRCRKCGYYESDVR